MPVAERLRALDGPAPDIDLEQGLREVRRRARSYRRRRTAVLTGATVAVAAVAIGVGALLPRGDDAHVVDTVDVTDELVRVLPAWVPEGFDLAWVDTPAVRPDESDLPLWKQWFDYAYGYQSDTAELQVNVHVGEHLDDPSTIAAEWSESWSVISIGGHQVLRSTDGTYTQSLAETDGAVIHVVTHPLVPQRDGATIPGPEVVGRFAASVRPVTEDAWRSALSQGVDVASTFGPKDGSPVISGDGWALMSGTFRAPVSVRHPSFWIDFDGTPSTALASGLAMERMPFGQVAARDGRRVAWGVLPGEARRVTVSVGGSTFSAGTETVAGVRVFAVDVGDAEGAGRFHAVDADGNHVGNGPIDTE